MATIKKHPGRTNDDHQFVRNIRFEVRLSEIEYDALVEQWHKLGKFNSMARYARACIFGEEDKIEIHLEQKKKTYLDRIKVQATLGRIASNFNQLAKQLNSKYEPIAAKTLLAEMEQIRIEIERISALNKGE